MSDGSRIVPLRAREFLHIEEGRRIIEQILDQLAERATLERAPGMASRRMTNVFAPIGHESGP